VRLLVYLCMISMVALRTAQAAPIVVQTLDFAARDRSEFNVVGPNVNTRFQRGGLELRVIQPRNQDLMQIDPDSYASFLFDIGAEFRPETLSFESRRRSASREGNIAIRTSLDTSPKRCLMISSVMKALPM